jgi:hypothetical protein
MWRSASHTDIEGRSVTLLVHGGIDQLTRLVIETLNAEGWVRITPSAPGLVFRARFFGWLPGAVWVQVGLSKENDGVMVSFTAYGSVTDEGDAYGKVIYGGEGYLLRTANKLADAFASHFIRSQ